MSVCGLFSECCKDHVSSNISKVATVIWIEIIK